MEPTTSLEVVSSTDLPIPVTTDASAIANQGVVLLQSLVGPSSTAEANPTVESSVPSTTPSDGAAATDPPSTEGSVESPSSSLEPSIPSSPSPTPLPSSLPSPDQPGSNGGNGVGLGGSDGSGENADADRALQPPTGRMSPMGERILVAVGSIGGFVLVCFIIWIAWRTVKSKKKGQPSSRGCCGLLTKRIPFLRQRGWDDLETSNSTRPPPPSYREKTGSTGAQSAEGFFGPEKAQLQQEQQQQPQRQPDSQPTPPVSDPWQPKTVHHPQFGGSNVYFTANPVNIPNMPNVAPYSHQPQESFSSTNAAQFGSMMSDYQVSTLQTGTAPIMYYNPALMTQPLAPPFNAIYRLPRQTVSDVSSLSSGFGDGDIIVSDSLITPPPPTVTTTTTTTTTGHPPHSISGNSSSPQPNKYTDRFSWMSSTASGAHPQPSLSRSGTVCTQTSEDRPARFRSVTSWVDQQTGRIIRARQREQTAAASASPVPSSSSSSSSSSQGSVPDLPAGHPGIPGIPNPPPGEQDFGLMMDDGEKARRVEDAVPSMVVAGR
ncbi:hypothetical protein VTK26DRAFT_8146 [Humicola hyalothermophila]